MTQFISLAEHSLALYLMPKFIWSVFWDENKEKLIPVVERICGGESFAKMCKVGDFPLPMTKKQCHALLNSPADRSFMKALRQIQIENHGGDIRLFQAWMTRDVGCRLHDKELEVFGDTRPYELWCIDEILTSKDLHKEGSTHKHCVASYGHSIINGYTSIWSMSRNGEKLITIEVRNSARNEEYKYMLEWAKDNTLQINIGRW